MSYNARGLGDILKRKEVFYWLNQKKGKKIFLLQETHTTVSSEPIWKNEWEGDILFSHGSSQARGVAILFKKDLALHIHNVTKDNQGRYIVADLEINGF